MRKRSAGETVAGACGGPKIPPPEGDGIYRLTSTEVVFDAPLPTPKPPPPEPEPEPEPQPEPPMAEPEPAASELASTGGFRLPQSAGAAEPEPEPAPEPCTNPKCKCPDCARSPSSPPAPFASSPNAFCDAGTCGSSCTCMVSAEVTCDPCVDFKKAKEAEAAAASAAAMEPEPEPAEDAAAEAAAAREQRAAQLAPPASPEAAPSGPDATLSAEDGALVVEELERQQGLLIRELSNDPENDDLSEKVKEVTVRLARVASSHDLSLSGPVEPEAEEPAGPDPDSEEWAPYYSALLKELIDTVPLLASLGITEPDFTWRLGLQLQSRAFAAGATVLSTGERSSELFFLARGAVRISPPLPLCPSQPQAADSAPLFGR